MLTRIASVVGIGSLLFLASLSVGIFENGDWGASTAYANEGCDPVSPAEFWDTDVYDCQEGPPWVIVNWHGFKYDDVFFGLACNNYGQNVLDQNQAFWLKAVWTTCNGTTPSGTLQGFDKPGGSLMVSIPFSSGSTSVSTDCMDSCNWPTYWELSLNTSISTDGFDEVDWYVGCCDCDEYSQPCI